MVSQDLDVERQGFFLVVGEGGASFLDLTLSRYKVAHESIEWRMQRAFKLTYK